MVAADGEMKETTQRAQQLNHLHGLHLCVCVWGGVLRQISAAAVCSPEELLPQCEISSASVMVSGLQLASVLLVWLLSELDSSSSFPAQARGSVPPEARPSLRERYNTWRHRPLPYMQALRKNPPGSPQPSAQLPNERDLSNRNQRPDPPGRPRSAPLRNRPIAESNLKVPLLPFQNQKQEPRPTTDRGQSKRPISFGIHFDGPSEFSMPRIQFDLSLPSSQLAQSSKTQSWSIGNTQPPEQKQPLGSFSHYTDPIRQGQIPTRQNPIIAELDLTKYPTRSLPLSYYPQQYANAYIGYNSAQNIPMSNIYGEGQAGQTVSSNPTYVRPPLFEHVFSRYDGSQRNPSTVYGKDHGGQTVSSNPTHVRPPLFEHVFSRYDGSQKNPSTVYGEDQSGLTVSPNPVSLLQYERFPSGLYNAGHVQPSRNNYGPPQTWQPVRTPPTSTSEQYSSWFKPSSGQKQETVPPSHQVQPSSTPIVAPSKYEAPFYFYNRQDPTAAHGPVGGQMAFSSSSGPASRGQSGPAALPDRLTAFGSSENVYSPTGYQTQTGSSGRVKPSYEKLLIDLDEGPGQTDYLAAPARTPPYVDNARQHMAETFDRKPSPPPQSMNPVRQYQQPGPLGSPTTNKPVYVRPPITDSGVTPCASNPKNQMLPEQPQVSDVVPQTG